MHLEEVKSKQELPMNVSDLTCPICLSIAGDPHITTCCNRIFCAKDADLNQYDNGCPLCRQRHFSFVPSPKHKEMLEHLTVKCECSEHVAPHEYDQHLERCSSTTLMCPHNTCRNKGDSTVYTSQELVSHLARHHCNEVSLLGSTFINKSSIDSYHRAAIRYDSLVSTLYSVVYPKMIDIQLKNASLSIRESPVFQCPQGHTLIEADHTKRKRKNGLVYTSTSYNCDICHHSFPNGLSWHCSCTDSGFDKCLACVVFQLYNIDNDVLRLAGQDKEKQQASYRRGSVRNIMQLSRGLFRLLSGNTGGNETSGDRSPLRQRSLILLPENPLDRGNNDQTESNGPGD